MPHRVKNTKVGSTEPSCRELFFKNVQTMLAKCDGADLIFSVGLC